MRRLINAVTALSMALYVVPPFAPLPAMAEGTTTTAPATTTTAPTVPAGLPAESFLADLDGATVLCLPDKKVECPAGWFCVVAKTKDQCLTRASKIKSLEAAKAATAGTAAPGATTSPDATGTAATTTTTETATTTEAPAATTTEAPAATAGATTATDTTTPATPPAAPVAVPVTLGDQTVICLPAKTLPCPSGAICVRTTDAAQCDKAAVQRLKGLAATKAKEAAAAAKAADQAAPATTETQATTATPPADQTAPAAGTTTAPADQTTTAPATTATTATTTAGGDQAATTTQDKTAPTAPDVSRKVTIGDTTVICLPDKVTPCPDGAICVRVAVMARCDAVAKKRVDQLATAAAEDKAAVESAKAAKAAQDAAAKAAEASGKPLVDAPKPTVDAVQSLDTAIATAPAEDATAPAADETAVPDAPAAAAAVVAADATPNGTPPAKQAPAPGAVVTEQTVTAADTRASSQEFAAAPATTADGKKKTGLSDLEKVGLVALGALVVGEMLKGNKQVVSNTGDRVVVKDQAGNYQVYKDDDTLLRQPGATVRTETFNDGSTRTTVTRADGTSVVTIKDATGRVIRRSSYDARGIETVLIDDTIPERPIDMGNLPPPAQQVVPGTDAALAARLAEIEAGKSGREFSLRQIRLMPRVKAMAPALPVPNVTFATASAAITPDQAENLATLGDLVKKLIRQSPNRIFLIEGHTDAVGSAASNLTLSDRRAESVAKALTEYFGVAPENLVVQGYGESELLIDTQGDERQNRRVVVRDITPLLRQTAN